MPRISNPELLDRLSNLALLDAARAMRVTDHKGETWEVAEQDDVASRGVNIGNGGILRRVGVHRLPNNDLVRDIAWIGKIDGEFATKAVARVQQNVELSLGNKALRFGGLVEGLTASVTLTDGTYTETFTGSDLARTSAADIQMLAGTEGLIGAILGTNESVVMLKGLEDALRSGKTAGAVKTLTVFGDGARDLDLFVQEGAVRVAIATKDGVFLDNSDRGSLVEGTRGSTCVRVVKDSLFVRAGAKGAITQYKIGPDGKIVKNSALVVAESSNLPGVRSPRMVFDTIRGAEVVTLTGFNSSNGSNGFIASPIAQVQL